ncbi:MAG: hypothetical protein ING19_18950 [Azospirillum sp.]|nr:hypothetical protein [Azospirillum sp.]
MHGSDLGAYMLGASIAGNNARALARLEAEGLKIKADREKREFREEIHLWAVEHAYEFLKSESRRRIRSSLRDRLKKIEEIADSRRISGAEIAQIFADEHDETLRGEVFLKHSREIAAEWTANSKSRAESIREALARIEKEYA